MSEIGRLVDDITAAPLGRIIASVGEGIAEAQRALDSQAIEQVLALYANNDDATRLLREIGWRPTFYTLPETEGEVRVALSLSSAEGDGRPPPRPISGGGAASPVSGGTAGGAGESARAQGGTTLSPSLTRSLLRRSPTLYATPVDGGYQNRYGFQGSVSATVRFRIVPVPPPPEADRIRVVPDLTGMELPAALRLVEGFELGLEVAGEASGTSGTRILSQDPDPGSLTRSGELIRVQVEEVD